MQHPLEVAGSAERSKFFRYATTGSELMADDRGDEVLWTEMVLSFPASFKKILMVDVSTRVAKEVLVQARKDIQKVYVIKPKKEKNKDGSPAPWSVQTDGVNLQVRYKPGKNARRQWACRGEKRGGVCVCVCVCVRACACYAGVPL